MATEILIKTGSAPIVWADATDYSDAASGLARTHQIDLTSLGAGSARQGAKADLGATRARVWVVSVCFEFASAPTSLEVVDCFWSSSPSSTAANANAGWASGSDAAYLGSASDSVADSVHALEYIGPMHVTSDGSGQPQYEAIGRLVDPMRYGQPVIFNKASTAFEGDAVEMYAALIPIVDAVQD